MANNHGKFDTLESSTSQILRSIFGTLAPSSWILPSRSGSVLPVVVGAQGVLVSGVTRTVYINKPPPEIGKNSFCSNVIHTTKYNLLTFLPKSLFEQFRRAGYWYFAITAFLSLTPVSPYSPITVIGPLIFVLGVSLTREAFEDASRAAADSQVDARPVMILDSDGSLQPKRWRDVKVGDVVKVTEGEYFPADLLLLYSSGVDGICYVETKNLDGETNLKVRQSPDENLRYEEGNKFLEGWNAKVTCEGPNASLYNYSGQLEVNGVSEEWLPLGPQQLLLRDSSLQNTDFILGAAIYTGPDTKSSQNGTPPRLKRSRLDHRLDAIVWSMFLLLVILSLVNAAGLAILTSELGTYMYYLRPLVDDFEYDPTTPWPVFGWSLVACVILYGYLIPLAMYVSLELIRVFQAYLISKDLNMCDENGNFANVKSAGLNEELGQVSTILSDKTGTLTCNQMDFFRCSIAGVSYGSGETEVERAAIRLGIPVESLPSLSARRLPPDLVEIDDDAAAKRERGAEKGYNLRDERLENGNWVDEPNPHITRRFLEILALCHTAIPEGRVEDGSLRYRAESPDEESFLVTAKRLGLIFVRRTANSLFLKEMYPLKAAAPKQGAEASQNPILGWLDSLNPRISYERRESISSTSSAAEIKDTELKYDLLSVVEFTSARKRMSVVVKDPRGVILLLCKGADVAIFPRLASGAKSDPAGTRPFVDETAQHMTMYGQAGLRTLVLAYRELDPAVYRSWENRYLEAKSTVRDGREQLLEDLAEELERDLIIVGGTGVEDKLQEGVPECIEKLALAGIKIWVLTGDKTDTAVNIAYASSLLRAGMEHVVVNLDSAEAKIAEMKALMVEGTEREKGEETLRRLVWEQLVYAMAVIERYDYSLSDDSGAAVEKPEGVALIIDGFAMAVVSAYHELQELFMDIASSCDTVLCCRVSPKQKSLVARMVHQRLANKGICLAIGDGANDVGMIQTAHVGVGITGMEGGQAAMAADYSISQFRFLERLLLVHGHWCYRRMAITVNYSLWKVVIHGLIYFYSSAITFWTGAPIFYEWYSTFYNTLFTAFPISAIGAMDQDIPANECLHYPRLYSEGQRNLYFNWTVIISWFGYSIYGSLVAYIIPLIAFGDGAINIGGMTASQQDVGTSMFTSLVLSANLLIYLIVNHFTWITHVVTLSSVASWYLFIIILGSLPVSISGKAYRVFVEVLVPSPVFWLSQALVVAAVLLPFLIFRSYQSIVCPTDAQIIVETYKKSREPVRVHRLRFQLPQIPNFTPGILRRRWKPSSPTNA